MYSVQTCLSDLAGVTHGTTVNKIPNVFGILNRAARAVLLDIDPKETQRIVQLGQVFNSVYDYTCPSDVKNDRIIDLRLQAGRYPNDVFTQEYAQTFDANKLVSFKNKIITQWNTGVKSLRIEAPMLSSPVVITDTSTLTGWTATAGAQNLSLDTTANVAGGGAITFDLAAGSTTGSIQISTLQQIDLTNSLNVDTEFYWVYLPTGSAISQLALRIGSDTTANYYTFIATAQWDGNSFQNGWNQIGIAWKGAAVTGNPVITQIDSVELIPTYNSTLQTGLKFCYLTSNPGTYFEIQYYSKFLFRNPSTNVFQETVVDLATDSSTVLNLDTDSYNVFFNKVAYYTAQALQGADADYDANFFGGQDGQGGEYGNALAKYRSLNPSEAMLKGSTYYQVRQNYNRFGNRFWRGPQG